MSASEASRSVLRRRKSDLTPRLWLIALLLAVLLQALATPCFGEAVVGGGNDAELDQEGNHVGGSRARESGHLPGVESEHAARDGNGGRVSKKDENVSLGKKSDPPVSSISRLGRLQAKVVRGVGLALAVMEGTNPAVTSCVQMNRGPRVGEDLPLRTHNARPGSRGRVRGPLARQALRLALGEGSTRPCVLEKGKVPVSRGCVAAVAGCSRFEGNPVPLTYPASRYLRLPRSGTQVHGSTTVKKCTSNYRARAASPRKPTAAAVASTAPQPLA
jgi:hypothetical protein